MFRAGRFGRVVFTTFAFLWTYLIAATYLLKLVPMYSGYPHPRAQLGALWTWYKTAGGNAILSNVALAPPALLWTLIAAALMLSVAVCSWLVVRTWRTL
jgi:hypothetical protein